MRRSLVEGQELSSFQQQAVIWTPDSVRQALDNVVKQNCCWGKKPVEEMEIKSMMQSDLWYMKMTSFTESRSTEKKSGPYKGEDVDKDGTPPGEWSMDVPQPEHFESSTKRYKVPYSDVLTQCQKCDGRGNITCKPCDGYGWIWCKKCNGKRWLWCSKCEKKGTAGKGRGSTSGSGEKGGGKESSKGHDEKGGGKDSSKGKGDVDQDDKGKGRGSMDSSKGAEKGKGYDDKGDGKGKSSYDDSGKGRGSIEKGAGKESSKGHEEKGGGKDSSKGKGDVDQEDKGKGRGSMDSSKGAEKGSGKSSSKGEEKDSSSSSSSSDAEEEEECGICQNSGWYWCKPCDSKGWKHCQRCKESGRVTCEDCEGCGMFLSFSELVVVHSNHKWEKKWSAAESPVTIQELRESSGRVMCFQAKWVEEEFHRANVAPDPKNALIELIQQGTRHGVGKDEYLHMQKLEVKQIPSCKVLAVWKGKEFSFSVFGEEMSVSAEEYPEQCCGCCVIQ